jgi:soluble lytic murein transglycosylase
MCYSSTAQFKKSTLQQVRVDGQRARQFANLKDLTYSLTLDRLLGVALQLREFESHPLRYDLGADGPFDPKLPTGMGCLLKAFSGRRRTGDHGRYGGLTQLRTVALVLTLVFGLTACSSMASVPSPVSDVIRSTPGSDTPAVRAAFRAALARVGQAGLPPADPPALRAYAIYSYLIAARLQATLSGHPATGADPQLDALIAAFLQEHRGEPVTRALARDWLLKLAMHQQWPTYLSQVGEFVGAGDDPALACDTLSARIATGATGAENSDSALASAALTAWSQSFQQPAACDGVFAWLQQQGLLTPERVEARARAALAAGHAGLGLKLAAQLSVAQAAPLLEWAGLLQRPRALLEALAQAPGMPVEPDALAAGIDRLALSDSLAAEAVLTALLMRPDMTPELAAQLQRSVALGLAYDHVPSAAAALQAVPEMARNDAVREWGVRIALWTGAWPQALSWLDQLPPIIAAEPRWRYWRARALEVVAGETVAAPLLSALAGLRDYYGYLAADRVVLPYDLQSHPTPADLAVHSGLAARPGLVRAHELFECGLTDSAELEWAVSLREATNAQRVQAAQLAEDWGWYAWAIAQLARADDLDDVALRYPRPYVDSVARASALTDVPADWLLAVMRQESLFRADAVSRANAQGLMQLLPTTASAVAQRWHVTLQGVDSLFDPATALTLGAAHLRELLNQYDGAIVLALAAYNAGAAPVARWRPAQPMDADVWIENIAYGETRDYVERILEHIVAYSWERGAPPPRLSSLLPAVGPVPVN